VGAEMKVTVATCWNQSPVYPVEYVNKLYSAVTKNTSLSVEFVLYTENKTTGVNKNIAVIKTGLPYWWSGMRFFQKNAPEINPDCALFLDLDVVIVGSIDDLLLYPSDFCFMKDYPSVNCPHGHERDANTGVTLMRNFAGAPVWDEYVKAGIPIWNPAGNEDKRLPLAAQGLINDLNIKRDLFPENWVCSYKLHEVGRKGLPDDCRIVHFHGRPKQHEVSDEFIERCWRGL
jgi:hypothetical protein